MPAMTVTSTVIYAAPARPQAAEPAAQDTTVGGASAHCTYHAACGPREDRRRNGRQRHPTYVMNIRRELGSGKVRVLARR